MSLHFFISIKHQRNERTFCRQVENCTDFPAAEQDRCQNLNVNINVEFATIAVVDRACRIVYEINVVIVRQNIISDPDIHFKRLVLTCNNLKDLSNIHNPCHGLLF